MQKFIIFVEQRQKLHYEVIASSKEEAIKLYKEDKAGKGEVVDCTDESVSAEEKDESAQMR